jgi:hypothetical protein
MTAVATKTIPSRNTAQIAKVKDKDGNYLKIGRKLKAALDMMVWEGKPWNEAAQVVNFDVSSMRKALERAHVRAYLNQQKEVFRASISSQNTFRLAQIRDQDENKLAALGAIRQLDNRPEEEARAAAAKSPGIVIFVGNDSQMVTVNPLTQQAIADGSDDDQQ